LAYSVSAVARVVYHGRMSFETKDQAAKRESIRLTKLLKWILWLPVPRAILCWGWLKALFCTPGVMAEQRAAEKERQSGIRREMRGLPAAHDGGKPVP